MCSGQIGTKSGESYAVMCQTCSQFGDPKMASRVHPLKQYVYSFVDRTVVFFRTYYPTGQIQLTIVFLNHRMPSSSGSLNSSLPLTSDCFRIWRSGLDVDVIDDTSILDTAPWTLSVAMFVLI